MILLVSCHFSWKKKNHIFQKWETRAEMTEKMSKVWLTCSLVSGNQYMHGLALVFRNRSSSSLAGGGSSSFFLNFRAGAGRCASNVGLRLRCRLFLSRSFFSRSLSLAKCWPSSLPKSHSRTTVTCASIITRDSYSREWFLKKVWSLLLWSVTNIFCKIERNLM